MRALAAIALVLGLLWAANPAAAYTVTQTPAEVEAYWTPERMEAALPIGLPTLGGEVASPQAGAAADGSRFAVGDPSAPGVRTHGKVFLTIPDLGNFVCSATVAASFSRSLVTTAGHCVSDGRRFATNWMFVPAYDDGNAPFGRWSASELGATEGWKDSGDLRFDVGMARMEPNADGKTIEEVVGAREIGFNRARSQFYHSFGYPSEQPPLEFTGEREFTCTSSWRGDDEAFEQPRPMQIACDMTAGSSGGGWVSGNTLLSVNSFKAGFIILPDNRFMYGPYFGDAVRALYQRMRGDPILCGGREATIFGSAASETLQGTRGNDVIAALGGTDTISGRGGKDLICGGAGNDTLQGGRGGDDLRGESGHDRLLGGRGSDRCDGGKGRDNARSCKRQISI